jgi:hypothetical protein
MTRFATRIPVPSKEVPPISSVLWRSERLFFFELEEE